MNKDTRSNHPVLALHPTTSGFGWVLFDGPLNPIDWNTAYVSTNRNARSLERIVALIERFRPYDVVLEQFEGRPARRNSRIRHLYRAIISQARKHGIEPRVLTREAIEAAFGKFRAKTRYEIAQTIAAHVQSFGHLLPPRRKVWLPEDPRMGLFNAAALAITFFALIDGEPFSN